MLFYLRSFAFLVALLALMTTGPAAHGGQVTDAELTNVLRRYQKIEELSVDFQQVKTVREMKRPLLTTGHLIVRPPASVIYEVTSPAALKVILSAQKITIESGRGADKSSRTFDVASLKGSREHRNLQAMVTWLQMNPHELAAHYGITRAEEHSFHFIPVSAEDSPFSSLDMVVNPSGDVTALEMNETSGDHIKFIFSAPRMKPKK